MKIAIEALGIHYYGGGRTATLNLLKSLLNIDNRNSYLAFLSQPEPTLNFKNLRQYVVPLKDRFLSRLWAQLYLPIQCRNFQIVHFAKNLGVFGITSRKIATIYDLTTLIHPDLFPKFDVWYWKNIQNITLQNVDKIIAISHTTAEDLVRYYNLSRLKISVIYPVIGKQFQPSPSFDIIRVRQRYHLPERYFVYVGRIDRKKNLTFLVKAFDLFTRYSQNDEKLVLVGKEYPKSLDPFLRPTIQQLGLEEKVLFAGNIPDNDLPAVYSGAIATVFTSLHEGFGLAPIEAMACATPVISLKSGAIKEISSDAALLLDSIDVEIFAEAMSQITREPELRQELIQRGLRRSGDFRGEESARQTLEIYQQIAAL